MAASKTVCGEMRGGPAGRNAVRAHKVRREPGSIFDYVLKALKVGRLNNT